MRIYADENMPWVAEFFGPLGEVITFAGRMVTAEQLQDADVLLVRSVTKVDAALLARNTRLRFVGTATIGIDHIDTDYLAARDIAFASAPGCNAVSVAEYVIAAYLSLCQKYHRDFRQQTFGIVGAGNIGSVLWHKLSSLGIKVLACDGPKAQAGDSRPLVSYQQVLAQADVISFHVPLVKQGAFATKHLLDAERLAALPPSTMLINASRGDVIDNRALLAQQQALGTVQARPLVLDVWENEPDILQDLLPWTDLATVHIAGHSLEGKARGTEMLYLALCRELALQPSMTLAQCLPRPAIHSIGLSEDFSLASLATLVHCVYAVERDDALLRNLLTLRGFDWLRKHYPVRREWSTVRLTGLSSEMAKTLQQFGFSV